MSVLWQWLDLALSAYFAGRMRPKAPAELYREELSFYLRQEILSDPGSLYRFPDEPPQIAVVERDRLAWADRFRIAFPSPFTPLCPQTRVRYEAYGENRRALAEWYRPSKKGRGALLYLHGWMAPSFELETRYLFAPLVEQGGAQLVALVLPFHMARRPAASSFSGEFFVSADLTRTLEAFRQAVAETRAVLAWLRQQTEGAVAVAGISLGALVAALALGGGAEPDLALLALTPADPAHTLAQSPLLRHVRAQCWSNGVTPEQMDAWAPLLRPAALRPRIPAEHLYLVHGREDQVSFPEDVVGLWEAWGHPPLIWYSGGHFTILFQPRRVLRLCLDFLERLRCA
ncbi:MAG: alpha/beta hydrolase family protein [Chloroflexia bacterium]